MDTFDLVIVGAGNAALSAAISAKENGAKNILVLEKASKKDRGGNSRYTNGAYRFAYKGFSDLKKIIIKTLDTNKAQDIISIDLKDKSSMADFMIIASGTSSRHIQSLSEQVLEKFKDNGIQESKIEGKDSNEWKLVDGIDLIVHIFNPEKRKFYELEKMWSELIPKEKLII